MRDFLYMIIMVVGVFAFMGLTVFLNYQLSYLQMALGGIALSILLIILFIYYGPGKRRRK
ncbi:hypothetical protein [Telluribacter sp.]|jgi:hypothetical protein|uniref:hypothetical protein n=1 Tax=Telluribacter sp. TaxID=1978767 RepID=UPI002E0D758F|nr:hypothetical protein [Telluribacter sp.]